MNPLAQRHLHRFLVMAAVLALMLITVLVIPWPGGSNKPSIAYLGWDEDGRVQLFRIDLDGRKIRKLTTEMDDIQSFSLSPTGEKIAYITILPNGYSRIWLMDSDVGVQRLLHECEASVCDKPVWHPDGRRLVYERRQLDEDGLPGLPHLWWLDTTSGESVSVLEDHARISQSVSFSPDGDWISYAGSPSEGVIVYNLEDGRMFRAASEMGTPASWHPDSSALIVRNHQGVESHDENEVDHSNGNPTSKLGVYLFLVSVIDGSVRPLTKELVVDDGPPSWSPDGERIAFGRMQPLTDMGRQLLLISTRGGEIKQLTDTPERHYGPPSWSPDGQYLLFQSLGLQSSNSSPSIWTLNVTSGQMQEIAGRGFQPVWIP